MAGAYLGLSDGLECWPPHEKVVKFIHQQIHCEDSEANFQNPVVLVNGREMICQHLGQIALHTGNQPITN